MYFFKDFKFRDLDILSPPITLFHYDRRTHTSTLGGYLVICMLTLCLVYISYLLYNVIEHKKVTAVFYKKYEDEAGFYSMNSSSFFHFIQIFSADNNGYFGEYSPKHFRIFTTNVMSNFNIDKLNEYDHWLYDSCKAEYIEENFKFSLLENIENYTSSACIKYFYNKDEKKYYDIGEKGFKWPYMEHGISKRNNIFLTTIAVKCSNNSITNTIFGNCSSQEEIEKYISQFFGFYFYFEDSQVDPTNFKNPMQTYLNTLSVGIGNKQSFPESYIHYSPVIVRTIEGNLLEKRKEVKSIYFDANRKSSADNSANGDYLVKFYHLLQNSVHIYERRYNHILDILSDVGGICQFAYYIFFSIYFFYNKFIILRDTNSLFFNINQDSDKPDENVKDKNSSLKNLNFNNGKKIKYFNSARNLTNLNTLSRNNLINTKSLFPSNNNVLHFNQDKIGQSNLLNTNLRLISKTNNKSNIVTNTISNQFNKSEINITNNLNHKLKQNVEINVNRPKEKLKSKFSPKYHKKESNEQNNKINNMSSSNIQIEESNYNINNNYIFSSIEGDFQNLKKIKSFNSEVNVENRLNELDRNKYKTVVRSSDNLNLYYKKIYYNRKGLNEEVLFRKKFSFYYFLKSCLLKNNNSVEILLNFRKNLLNVEHLFKSHVLVLSLKKCCKESDTQTINIIECYNGL